MQQFPVIIGPTAGGKSSLSISLAKLLGPNAKGPIEIISADSMQVYRGMDIGTATPTPQQREGFTHHLIDIRDPDEPFSVSDWLNETTALIDDIRSRDGLPIVAGGTHLYIKALLDGLFEGPPADEAIRNALRKLENTELHAQLKQADPLAATRIHPNDRRRMVRALEVFQTTGKPISQVQQQWDVNRRPDALLVLLLWPTEEINTRINARVRTMMEQGLLDEVRTLHESGAFGQQSREALGYKQLLAHLEGKIDLDEAVERIKRETRRFAKSQRTWIRRLSVSPPVLTIQASTQTPEKAALEVKKALFTE